MTDGLAQKDVASVLRSFSRALHPRELASRLGVSAEDYPELIALLDRFEQEGRIKQLPGGRVRWNERGEASGRNAKSRKAPRQDKSRNESSAEPSAPKIGSSTWAGSISVHPRGFAFVTAPGKDDIFIPADALYEAMHGDTVIVRVTGKSPKGFEGVIDGVKERRDPKIPGVIRKKRKACWLEPDDSRIRGPITLVGDLDAARDGDAAVVTITRFPAYSDELPEAELLQLLGPAGDPQTEVKKILLRESVAEEHSAEALKNAEQMATRLGAIRLGKRVDLRRVPLPTIDPEDARDHDDAVWVERAGRGYRVWVAIADVSEYVRPDSPLDEEARERGCTIYLPDRAIPMLPRALAGDLCSLLPEQDRFCMCVIADVDQHGRTQNFEIVEGVMRSAAKLTYAGVARSLGFDDESPQSVQAETFKSDLQVLAELAEKLRKNRMQRGALDLDLPEARIVLDPDSGAPVDVKKRATRPGLKRAYGLIEELMLLANELVAQWLDERQAPAIYRVHGKPDDEKLDRLAKITEQLAVKVDIDSLSEPLGASRFLKDIRGLEKQPILEMLLLRSLKQAVYDIDNIGHFGLASPRYVHFTSPIRRYPDLRVHRQIKHLLRGGRVDNTEEALDDLRAAAAESSKKERAAMEIEREVQNLYRTIYMQNRVGERFSGRITGLSSAGLYASIDDPCVDVMIAFDQLGSDQYDVDDDELGVVGRRSKEHVMLGDTMELEVIDISIVRRTVYARRITADGAEERRSGESSDEELLGRSDERVAFSPRPGARKTFRATTSARRTPKTHSNQRSEGSNKSHKPSSDPKKKTAQKAGTSTPRGSSDAGSRGRKKTSSSQRSSSSKPGSSKRSSKKSPSKKSSRRR